MGPSKIVLSILLGSFAIIAQAEISIISLNLHGFHPTGESERYYEFKSGKVTLAPSHLHYFTKQELMRGHKNRISKLSTELAPVAADLIFLQEVGAGDIDKDGTNCKDFYNLTTRSNWKNSALQLTAGLKKQGQNYNTLLACRGNIGWFTGPINFKDRRIVTVNKSKKIAKIIFDYNEDPYPDGILVEGMALLISDRFTVIEHKKTDLTYNSFKGKLFLQLVVIEDNNNSNRYLLLNVHLGHKVEHFEQAVAIRKLITKYENLYDISGVITGGDFNARLYRPKGDELSEISTIPFEISLKNSYDFSVDYENFLTITKMLKKELTLLNQNKKYKRWASIPTSKGARKRINQAVNDFGAWQIKEYENGKIVKRMVEAVSSGSCIKLENIPTKCSRKSRIDHFFISGLTPIKSAILYPKNSWTTLKGPTDHPGIYSTVH